MIFLSALISASVSAQKNGRSFYFDKEPFIHPRIVEDLSTWLSDGGEQVVSINIRDSVNSNRYFGDIQTRGEGTPFVFHEDKKSCEQYSCTRGVPYFGYKYLGTTTSGIHALLTTEFGGGSGRFRSVMLVATVVEHAFEPYHYPQKSMELERKRWVIKRLGIIHLGDRYSGEIRVNANELHIGKDQNPNSVGNFPEDTVIRLEVYPDHARY